MSTRPRRIRRHAAGRHVAAVCALALLVSGCALRRSAAVLPTNVSVREFEVPWENAFPGDIVVDGRGRVWFTDRIANVIGLFDPETEQFSAFATPTPHSVPYGLALAPDGMLWFTEHQAGRLARLDPATGRIAEFELRLERGRPQLLTWHGGRVWFTVRDADAFGALDPASGEVSVYTVDGQQPYGIAAAGGSLWMSVYAAMRLVQADPATGAVRVHDLLDATVREDSPAASLDRYHAGARRLGAGPAAGAAAGVWFTDFGRGRIVHYRPATAAVRVFESIEARTEPYGLTVTRRGVVWWGEKATNRVVALDPATGERLRVPLPTPGGTVRDLTVDEERGRVWVPVSDIGRIVLIELR